MNNLLLDSWKNKCKCFNKHKLNQPISIVFFFFLLLLSNNLVLAQIKEITYIVTINAYTPEDETVVLHLARGYEFIPMSRISENQWKVTVDLPQWWTSGTERYKYCRNYMAGGADEEWEGRNEGFRERTFTTTTTVNDVVNKWRWLPVSGVVPEINTSLHLSAPPNTLPPTSFRCGIQLPDYWWQKSFSPVVIPTLNRIVKHTNANWIQYAPVPLITRYYPTLLIEKEGQNGTPEAELIKIITESHNRGLKVFLNPFPNSLTVQATSPELHNEAWWRAYEAQWRPIILYYAQIAQQYNVEMLSFLLPGEQKANNIIPVIESLFQTLLIDVRSVYKGKICIPYHLNSEFEIYRNGDYLSFKIWDWWPYKLSNTKNPSVQEMTNSLRTGLNDLSKQTYEKYGKPLILHEIAACSFDGSVLGTTNWENHLYWSPDDPNYPVDLQEQADAYEAIIQAISEKTWIEGAFSFNYNYWNSLDKAPSIRYKPAEKVVAKWWRWIQPNNVYLSFSSMKDETIEISSISYVLKKDTTVNITAPSYPEYKFLEWSGDVTVEQKKNNPLTLKMGSNKNIIAKYIKIPTNTQIIPASAGYSIDQNYPNPFNSITTFKFGLPTESIVSIDVSNIDGKCVFRLENIVKYSGNHSLEWDANNLSSGVYFYRFNATPTAGGKSFSQTKKIVLFK